VRLVTARTIWNEGGVAMMFAPRMTVLGAALVVSGGVARAAPISSDGPLFAALAQDRTVGACRCVLAAYWLNQSYARVVVDERRWQRLVPAARTQLARRALAIAEHVYLAEFAAVDQYERVFVVDRHGKPLLSYGSG